VNTTQSEKVRTGRGFFAALDQSGGSTPKALAEYGIGRDRYSSDAEMFDLVHAMRTRVLTSPAFDGSRVLAAILFEQTMEGLTENQTDEQFNAQLESSIEQIYQASVHKQPASP